MASSKFLYIDIPLTGTLNIDDSLTNLTYDKASKTAGEILFEAKAIRDCDDYDSFEDMVENYPKEYFQIYLNHNDIKIPVVRIHATDSSVPNFHRTYYYYLDCLCNYEFVNKTDYANTYCICDGAPSEYPGGYGTGIAINFNGSITMLGEQVE